MRSSGVRKPCNPLKHRRKSSLNVKRKPVTNENFQQKKSTKKNAQPLVLDNGPKGGILKDKTNKADWRNNVMVLRTGGVKHDLSSNKSHLIKNSDVQFENISEPVEKKKEVGLSQLNLHNKKSSLKEDVLHNVPMKECYVLLKDICNVEKNGAVQESSSNDHKKTCVYKTMLNINLDVKPTSDMLPEEKLALYEFEVDENEPKQVKKKTRKYKPRKKKCNSSKRPIKKAAKQMLHLITKNDNKVQNSMPVTIASTSSSPHLVTNGCKSCSLPEPDLIEENAAIDMSKHVNLDFRVSRRPKLLSDHSPKTVRFANNSSSSNSSPPRASCQIGDQTSPHRGPRRRGVSSMYIRPSSSVHHNFVLDESLCSEEDGPQKTPPNKKELTPVLRKRRSRQISMQHFLSPESDANVSVNSTKTNLDASGLFDDVSNSPCKQGQHSPKDLSLSFSSFVTQRKKYVNPLNDTGSPRVTSECPKKLSITCNDPNVVQKKQKYIPRVSGFKPRDIQLKSIGQDFNLQNYFGFNDSSSEDEMNNSLQLNNLKRSFNGKLLISSTPNVSSAGKNKSAPARVSIRQLKKMLAPLVAKKPVCPEVIPETSIYTSSPTSKQSSTSSDVSTPKSAHLDNNSEPIPPTLYKESNVLTPVSFFEDELPAHFTTKSIRKSYEGPKNTKKTYYSEESADEEETPKKVYKRKKREVKTKDSQNLDRWAADINSHFHEIEDVELCVE